MSQFVGFVQSWRSMNIQVLVIPIAILFGFSDIILAIFLSQPVSQGERYLHLSAEEMSTVEKCVSESMGWMNSKMNAQSKLGITQDPIVKVADIIAKIQVCK